MSPTTTAAVLSSTVSETAGVLYLMKASAIPAPCLTALSLVMSSSMTSAHARVEMLADAATVLRSSSTIRIFFASASATRQSAAHGADIVHSPILARSCLYHISPSKKRRIPLRTLLLGGSRHNGAQLVDHMTGRTACMLTHTVIGDVCHLWDTHLVRARTGCRV